MAIPSTINVEGFVKYTEEERLVSYIENNRLIIEISNMLCEFSPQELHQIQILRGYCKDGLSFKKVVYERKKEMDLGSKVLQLHPDVNILYNRMYRIYEALDRLMVIGPTAELESFVVDLPKALFEMMETDKFKQYKERHYGEHGEILDPVKTAREFEHQKELDENGNEVYY